MTLVTLGAAIQVGRTAHREALQHLKRLPRPEPIAAKDRPFILLVVLLLLPVPALLAGATWWLTGQPGLAVIPVAVCYITAIISTIVMAFAQLRDDQNKN